MSSTNDRPGHVELPPTDIIADGSYHTSQNGQIGGGSGKGSNWSFGFGGSSGGGFSGGFGGSSRKKAKKRAKAAARAKAEQQAQAEALALAQAEANAQAEREQAAAAHRQLIETLTQTYTVRKADLDRAYAERSTSLAQQLEAEIRSAKKAPNSPGNERWQLYLISKEKSEIDGLIANKTTELQVRNAQATAFDGYNPLMRAAEDYKYSLAQHSPAAANNAHQQWERSYAAAHEAKILSESIRLLNDKSNALTAYYAEQEIEWRRVDAIHEGYRQAAEQRKEQIKYKLRADEDTRRNLTVAANTLSVPLTPTSTGALLLTRNGAFLAEGIAAAMDSAIGASIKELGRIAAIRIGQTVSLTVTALLYSPEVGNGELTPEQRRRLFQGVGVGADALGMPENADLPAIAAAQGSVALNNRIKALPVEDGTELNVVNTGENISPNVRVFNAVFDPLTNTFRAQTGEFPAKLLVFKPPVDAPKPATVPTSGDQSGLFKTEPLVADILPGVDIRIDDCIVCFPAELGLPPQYFSFNPGSAQGGIVVGSGQPASSDWWRAAAQAQGAAFPTQVGDRLRNREFRSIDALDRAVWTAIAEDPTLTSPFDEFNRARMARGYAPYAPKATWVGERREFEIRQANEEPFDLDNLKFTTPNSEYGSRRTEPSFLPWPVSSGIRTWLPLIPPGSESLGPTELPIAPEQPTVYPGETTDPIESQNESLPAIDPAEANASIPGYGEDDDLPSPDLVFAGPPVEPLEVGPYNELAGRSRLDGLDMDHIGSQQALKLIMLRRDQFISPQQLRAKLLRAPSIAIPAEIHRKYSETYGGRNTLAKIVEDARDLRAAVDNNLNAVKAGLLEAGYEEQRIEAAREELHKLNEQQGWYK